ncbi:PREDICTED: WD repeat-containing protein 55-like isoform X2 [Amphimedon queenslandica]|nr:PREDICTED: WD repeat-containing protein 55-like isoform X2 [Amphimedon queenslandica]|eukprot:XP_019852681.1 PREDICTED: WD repeat-containing protein 55-like isoform X2 [Amphimedon queenslandica]
MASSIEKQTLLCTSGDGSLSAVDLRQRKLEQRSDCSESELLCITLVKGGAKIVTGDAEGVLGIFTWGLWGDVIDRYPLTLRSQSIDSSIQISDSVVCAGGLDGIIRVVQILPNKTICELGRHHGSECSYPVEELRLSHDKTHLLSSSYDQVNSWPIGDLPKVWIGGGRREKEEQEEEEEEEQEDVKERRRGGKKSRRKRRRKELLAGSQPPKKRDTFFDDL